MFAVAWATITLVIAFSLWKGLRLVWCHYARKSPLRHLRGPKGTSYIFGSMVELIYDGNIETMESWVKEYGRTLSYKGLFNVNRLFTIDARATNHILAHSNDYQKSPVVRRGFTEILGEGLLVVEGAQHRQQRHIMNPAFGPVQVRALTDTFLAKTSQLRDLWFREIANDRTGMVAGTRIDIVPWLSKVTLDIIGLTGFNYDFNSLGSSEQPNEPDHAFSILFSANQSMIILNVLLRAFIPALRLIPTAESRKIRYSQHAMTLIGEELLKKAKLTSLADEMGKCEVGKSSPRGRDLLSLLAKANIATDIAESQQLSDKDVIAQVPTFLFAGHETMSTAVTWSLYALAQETEIQMKLRNELISVNTDTPSMDELMGLPYLDAVVKETLRMYPPIVVTPRMAMKDDEIPVEKSYVDRYGVIRNTILIAKGDEITIPTVLINRSKEIWGTDAHEFKPERWDNPPETVSRAPGVWSHLMTFLAGPRACIGYRFAVVELKAILFVLVRAFEFELAVPASEVRSRVGITQRPFLRGDPKLEPQLPLLVRPYQRD